MRVPQDAGRLACASLHACTYICALRACGATWCDGGRAACAVLRAVLQVRDALLPPAGPLCDAQRPRHAPQAHARLSAAAGQRVPCHRSRCCRPPALHRRAAGCAGACPAALLTVTGPLLRGGGGMYGLAGILKASPLCYNYLMHSHRPSLSSSLYLLHTQCHACLPAS